MVTGGAPVAGFPGAGCRDRRAAADRGADQAFPSSTDAPGSRSTTPTRRAAATCCSTRFADGQAGHRRDRGLPFGRRQMRFELLPLLEAVAAHEAEAGCSSPRCATSCRRAGRPAATRRPSSIINRHFDLVLVHGDPAFARSATRFRLPRRSPREIAYTGLVAAPRPAPSPERYDVVVSAGGGAAGRLLVDAAVDAATRLAGGKRWCLITGPNLPQADFDAAVGQGAGRSRDRPLPQRLSRPAGRCRAVRFAGRLQHRLRHPAGRLPLASSCLSRPAARPSRRCARAGLNGSDWPCRCPRTRCRRQASPQPSNGSWRAKTRARTGSTSTARANRPRCCAAAGEARLNAPRSA